MSEEAHGCIDVEVFIEILENDFFHNEQTDKSDVLSLVQKNSSVEIRFIGLEIDVKKEIAGLKFKQYGFRFRNDFKIETRQSIFDNVTFLTLIPQKAYELKDSIENLPEPYCEKGKKLSLLLGDTFERLKVKSKNILQNSASDEMITHYAKKNIQVAMRNCYDAREMLIKIQKTKNRDAINLAIMANVYIINVHSYLLKMFSSYYVDKKNLKDKQIADFFRVMDLQLVMEPLAEYKKAPAEKEELKISDIQQIKWNLQVNQLITLIYDLMHSKTEDNLPALEAEIKDIQDLLNIFFVDKEGKTINRTTIKTCLKPGREDKRAKGNKRIDVSKYL